MSELQPGDVFRRRYDSGATEVIVLQARLLSDYAAPYDWQAIRVRTETTGGLSSSAPTAVAEASLLRLGTWERL